VWPKHSSKIGKNEEFTWKKRDVRKFIFDSETYLLLENLHASPRFAALLVVAFLAGCLEN
jgi:hypothetical protein